MRQILAAEIKDLEAQETGISNEIERVRQAEPVDSYLLSTLIAELETLRARLDNKRDELHGVCSAAEEINFAIVTAQEELDSVLDNLQVDGEVVSIRAFTVDEGSYQALYISLKQLIASQTATAASNLQVLKESYEAQIKDLNADKMNLTDQLTDMTAKRDAAAAAIVELTEAKEESARLTEENEKLRNQIITAGTQTSAATNEDGKAALQEWKNNRPGIYNIRWKDTLKQTHYLAELETTGETIEIPRLEKGKYREVTSEEAERFRAEANVKAAIEAAESERLAQEAIQNQPLVIVPPTFQFPEDPTNGLVMEPSEEVGAVGTRQEYEARFKRIEEHLGLKTWNSDEDQDAA